MPLYTGGYLNKTAYSYLSRETADFSGLTYNSQDFTVEIAVDVDVDAFIGDYGELIRHSAANSAFQASASGWTIGTEAEGYGVGGGITLRASVNGNSQRVAAKASAYSGKLHVVMTFTASTGAMKLYVNGSLATSATNSLVVMPSTLGGNLAIGAANKLSASTTPSVSGYAMPEFGFYYARIWNDDLTSTDVSDLYMRWNGTGRTDPPTLSTGTIVSAWYGADQVSDKNGSAGTGWLKDNIGGNHLKICDTGAIVGGTQPTVRSPSGSVRITSPANSATGVSGAAVISADGTMGTGSALNYYIEVDEVNTFNGANLRNSGWLLQDGYWQPLLKPSTTYYARVKARDAEDTGTESSWSSTVSFTTRAVTTWYARPYTTAGTYGNEDGTSYANAWNDARWNGEQNGLAASSRKAQIDRKLLAPGDTLYLCDDWGLFTTTSTTLQSNKPKQRILKLRGLSATHQVNLRADHATYPGRFFKFLRYSGTVNWTSEGDNTWSTPTYIASAKHVAIAIDGVPYMAVNAPDINALLLEDATLVLASPGFCYNASKLYVKTETGESPGDNLWYMFGSSSSLFDLLLMDSTYAKIQGGEWYGTFPMRAGYVNTYVHSYQCKIKYHDGFAVWYVSNGNDNWTIEDCECSYAKNAVYGINSGTAPTYCGDNCTVKNSWIHHMGVTGFYDSDAHCVGWQSGSGWVVEDNLLHDCGTAIEQWGSTSKESLNNTVQRNIIYNATEHGTYGSGIAFTNNSDLSMRTGNVIQDNIIIDTEGNGIHISFADPVTIQGNLLIRVGQGAESTQNDGISFRNVPFAQAVQATITDNVIVEPKSRYINLGGSGTLTGVTCDQNVYWTDGTSSSTADKFRSVGVNSGNGVSFTTWLSLTTFDDLSAYQDPTAASLPNDFDDMAVTFFLDGVVGDVNADDVADGDDLTALQADPGAPRLAMERYLETFMAEAPPTPAPGGGTAGAGRATVWSLLMRRK